MLLNGLNCTTAPPAYFRHLCSSSLPESPLARVPLVNGPVSGGPPLLRNRAKRGAPRRFALRSSSLVWRRGKTRPFALLRNPSLAVGIQWPTRRVFLLPAPIGSPFYE